MDDTVEKLRQIQGELAESGHPACKEIADAIAVLLALELEMRQLEREAADLVKSELDKLGKL